MAANPEIDRAQLEVELPKAAPAPARPQPLGFRALGAIGRPMAAPAAAGAVLPGHPHQVHHHYHHAAANAPLFAQQPFYGFANVLQNPFMGPPPPYQDVWAAANQPGAPQAAPPQPQLQPVPCACGRHHVPQGAAHYAPPVGAQMGELQERIRAEADQLAQRALQEVRQYEEQRRQAAEANRREMQRVMEAEQRIRQGIIDGYQRAQLLGNGLNAAGVLGGNANGGVAPPLQPLPQQANRFVRMADIQPRRPGSAANANARQP